MRRERPRLFLGVGAFAFILLASCSEIKVHHRAILDRVPANEAAVDSPAPLDALNELRAGLAMDVDNPEMAIASYRQAAMLAWPQVLTGGVSVGNDPSTWNGPEGVYRRAVEYILLAAQRSAVADGGHWTEVLIRQGIVPQGTISGYPAEAWEDALPSRSFEVEGFHRQIARGGLGTPLTVSRHRADEPAPDEKYYPPRHFKGATAVLRPGFYPGEGSFVLELHDPVAEPDMLWSDPTARGSGTRIRPLPMAYDLTTPLAQQFHDNSLSLAALLGVLSPSKLDEKTGIYMMDPYDPQKIPVVMVHGLWSSPEGWSNAVNELRGDPELRKRYQFWLFFYSTGNPILDSASQLKKAIFEARDVFDADHGDPQFDRMVLIGHSMGGLLSRINVSSSGMNLWNEATKVPPEALRLEPKLKQRFMDALIFEPSPMVGRVVFVATPHQGSPLGYQFVGRLASSLIRLPQTVTEMSKALSELNVLNPDVPTLRDRRQLTGVAQLSSRNKMLQIVSRLPIKADVPYHSIIGFNGKEGLPEGGDGVVPYLSSHIEGAVSEVIVASGHSAQENVQAILEMKRILNLHIKEIPAISRPEGATPIRFALDPAGPDDLTGKVE